MLGKKSGLVSIAVKAKELGLDLPEARHAEVLARVKEQATAAKRLITDEEFLELAGAATLP